MDFLYNIADSIESFFKTPFAALIGTIFVISMVCIVLILLKYYESK